jgi:hypothetical protein
MLGATTIRQVQDAVYTTANFVAGWPYVAIMAGILAGGAIVWYIFFWVTEYFTLGEQRASRYVLQGCDEQGKHWVPQQFLTGNFVRHLWQLWLQTVFFTGLVFIIWLAASIAGFDPWATSLTTIGISAIATYVFAQPLNHLGCGYFILLTRCMMVGDYWELQGNEKWCGRVTAIFSMWVEFERRDEETNSGEIICVWAGHILQTSRKINMHRAATFKAASKSAAECRAALAASTSSSSVSGGDVVVVPQGFVPDSEADTDTESTTSGMGSGAEDLFLPSGEDDGGTFGRMLEAGKRAMLPMPFRSAGSAIVQRMRQKIGLTYGLPATPKEHMV